MNKFLLLLLLSWLLLLLLLSSLLRLLLLLLLFTFTQFYSCIDDYQLAAPFNNISLRDSCFNPKVEKIKMSGGEGTVVLLFLQLIHHLFFFSIDETKIHYKNIAEKWELKWLKTYKLQLIVDSKNCYQVWHKVIIIILKKYWKM